MGAGTGLLTKFLLEKYPNAQVTLVDLSKNMLEIAQKRFEGNDNITYLQKDYLTCDFDFKADIVMSSLSIHHLSRDKKKELYEKYVDILKDEGVLINADLVLDRDLDVEEIFFKKTDDLIIDKISKEAFEKANERRKFDKQDTVKFQIHTLKNAGCRLVGTPYKFYNYAVLWAKK